MKTKNKALLLSFCAVLLVAASVLGTVAYLTFTTETVENTFTVGNVAITLDEADVDEYGKVESEKRVLENKYKLIPGHTYVKDPTVTVEKGSEECYVRMKVTINELSDLQAIFGADFLPQNYVTGWDNAVWVSTKEVAINGDTATYEFRYHEAVDAREGEIKLDALFDEIKVPGTVSQADLAKLSGLKIDVVAEAIQADGFEDADAAWDAFAK